MKVNESFQQGSFSHNLTSLRAIVLKCHCWASFSCFYLGHPPSCGCFSLGPQHHCVLASSLLWSDVHCSLFPCRTDLGLTSGKAGCGLSVVQPPEKSHSPVLSVSSIFPLIRLLSILKLHPQHIQSMFGEDEHLSPSTLYVHLPCSPVSSNSPDTCSFWQPCTKTVFS